ncbi:MAG: TonB-dependent receptor [Bacteroidota bacterium]
MNKNLLKTILGLPLIVFVVLAISGSVLAQNNGTVSGKVIDETGEPLPGVTVLVKGTMNGTVSDFEGSFTLSDVPMDGILVFSSIGMKSQEVQVAGQTQFNITLQEDVVGLEEIVVVGYGTQKKASVTGSIAMVENDELTIAPVTSTSNALAGRLPGLISKQSTGQPGADAASISIRGFGNALIIVDGVQADFNSIDPNQIESISILKDASAAIYGSRAGNGVILVTTKRGNIGKPTFTLNSSYTLQGITAMPKTPTAGQFAEMRRETHLNLGLPEAIAPFTEAQIQAYYKGGNPQYPNTNWYDELIRDWAPQKQSNISVRGGTEKLKFYGFLGYANQETMWKKNGGDYTRYNLQSNIDAQILDNLSMKIDIQSTIEHRRYPWRPMDPGSIGIWADFWNTEPIFPAHLPDPTKISFAEGIAHVTSNRELAGYNDSDALNSRATFTLNYDVKQVPGLSARLFFNYNQYHSMNKIFMAQTDLWTYDFILDEYTKAGHWGGVGQLNMGKSESRNITTNLALNYDKTFGANDEHDLKVLVLYEAIDSKGSWFGGSRTDFMSNELDQMYAGGTNGMGISGSATEMGRVSYVGRINYGYKYKYLFETTLRADASAKFREDVRWGYFPSFMLGWRMSEESFLNNSSIVNDLKLRATYGFSGDEGAIRDFSYLPVYQVHQFQTYILDGSPQLGMYSPGLPNPFLTWLEMTTYNFGVDFILFENKIYGEADVFYRERNGIPSGRLSAVPNEFGAFPPLENLNSDNTRGFELLAGSKGVFSDIKYNINGNISWSRTKWDHFEESPYDDPDQIRLYQNAGQWNDRVAVYASDGLFTSQDEIDALEFDQDHQGNITLRPGDVRYIDSNDDGLLDWRDTQVKEGIFPHWMYGFNINLSYKGFDFTTLLQGAFGYSYLLNLYGTGKVLPQIVYDERWTEENNNADGILPRLGGSWTNGLMSDFNYIQAGYLRMKTTSLGYNLPTHIIERVNLKNVKVFISGLNLFTLSKLNKYDIDPEAPSGASGMYYPQQRTITFGTTIIF